MPTLRIEADYIVTRTGAVSAISFPSYEEASAYSASQLTALGGAASIDFVKYTPATDVYSGVIIGKTYGSSEVYAKIISDWYHEDFDLIPKIPLSATHSVSPTGSYTSEVTISAEVMTAIMTCGHVFYHKSGGSGVEDHGITLETHPVTGVPVYILAYGFYSATNSNIRGFISGHGLIFDSSAPDPDPYDWGPPQYAAALVWNAPPDIFWTNRVLCEETQS